MKSLIMAVLTRIPGLMTVIGKNRFATFVTAPVPPHVLNLKPRFDVNITYFTFAPPFDQNGTLTSFDRQMEFTTPWVLHNLFLIEWLEAPTRVFYRTLPAPMLKSVWLYLNDATGRGAILVLSWRGSDVDNAGFGGVTRDAGRILPRRRLQPWPSG